jgi:hypothetical protein
MRVPCQVGVVAVGCWLLSSVAGCSGSKSSDGDRANGGDGNRAGSADNGPDLGTLAGSGGSSSSAAGNAGSGSVGDECAGQLIEAQRIPLDMYVMLDISGSMLEVTEGDASLTKWQAVSSALADFVSDDASAGIGVGLQLFPLKHPDAPTSCSSNADCGSDYGRCFSKTCWSANGLAPCDSDDECGRVDDCIPFGFCQNNESFACPTPGADCGMDDMTGAPLGTCIAQVPQCTLADDCRAVRYATPEVPIGELPGAEATLVRAIQAAKPDRYGLTPSGPALAGAISLSSNWAVAHPERQVVAVLASDGMPTLEGQNQICAAVTTTAQVQAVSDLAGRGKQGAPPISTFVIGVVGPDDTGARDTLNSIANAGGSKQAFIVDTGGDVRAQFREALAKIRAAGLSCELSVPQATGTTMVDYDLVNVDFTDKTGKVDRLLQVASAAACTAVMNRGWYYDDAAKPTRILTCPTTCADFQATDMGSVKISLGCKTRKVK